MLIEPIPVEGGLISGVAGHTGRCQVFKGVPFAAPPLGELRWRAPASVIPWDGVRKADRYGDACIQASIPDDSIMRQFSFDTPAECGLSEDCLYLNVWTPAASADAALPVVVWLYGGGHRFGSGSHPVSDGENLALKGCVVISINYRLGALGYLAHPELSAEAGSSGNYAALDILAGLRWIQHHVAKFGGDPGKVSLMGQSAGAAHVSVLMASRLAEGLFQRAIAISSGRFSGGLMGAPMKTLQAAEQVGQAYMAKRDALTLAQMRQLPAGQLLQAERGLWGPIIDGEVLKESVQSVFESGRQLNIPLMAGYTADEASAYPLSELHTAEGFRQFADTHFGERAHEMLALYPHRDDGQARVSSYLVRRDLGFAFQVYQFARLHAIRQARTYLFNFTHRPHFPRPAARSKFHEPTPPMGFGAYHGAELWYVFSNLDKAPYVVEEQDHRLAGTIGRCLVNFADSGNPEDAHASPWPAFDDAEVNAMLFGEYAGAGEAINAPALKLFTDFYMKKP